MPDRQSAPYGSWPSAVTVDMLVAGGRQPSDPRIDGDDVWFLESRPDESGRVVVRRWSAGTGVVDVTPEGTNVRTRVHEYGGGAWAVRDGVLVFSTFPDGHVHLLRDGRRDRPGGGGRAERFADFSFDPVRDRVLAVCEDHTGEGEPVNSVVSIDLATGDVRALCAGHDFFSDPRVSPDGSRLCWLTWDRPLMPWDGTSLWVADLDADGVPGEPDAGRGRPRGVGPVTVLGTGRLAGAGQRPVGLVERLPVARRHCARHGADGRRVRASAVGLRRRPSWPSCRTGGCGRWRMSRVARRCSSCTTRPIPIR